jgi:hypothetical protein
MSISHLLILAQSAVIAPAIVAPAPQRPVRMPVRMIVIASATILRADRVDFSVPTKPRRDGRRLKEFE